MLAAQIKDVQYCPQGKHLVPRADIVEMLNDNGKGWRKVCQACKDRTMEQRRVNRKQAR